MPVTKKTRNLGCATGWGSSCLTWLMNQFNSDYSGDGDWEERGEMAWREAEWNHYLSHCSKDVGQFLAFYEKSNRAIGHLDEIARLMGWEVSDWSANDTPDGMPEMAGQEETEAPEEEFEGGEPYTIHRHPVFIVSQGLFLWLKKTFEQFLDHPASEHMTPSLTWKYAHILQEAEHQAVMGTHALDLADYSLAICHYKRALTGINETFSVLEKIFKDQPDAEYRQEINARLFDLRELYLRIIGECRYFESADFQDPPF
jgi:hypothetical protein